VHKGGHGLLQSIREMLRSFEDKNIDYCHWKSNANLEVSLNGDEDLDMIFRFEQKNDIEMILNQHGLKRFRSTSHMQYNGIEDFIGFDKSTAKIWHLHLHYRLSLGEKHLKGYTVPWINHILNNRIYNSKFEIYHSRPEDEYSLLLLRIALKLRWRDWARKIDIDDIKEINWLEERTENKQVLENVKYLLGNDVAEEFSKLLRRNPVYKKDFIRIQRKLRRSMKQFTYYNNVTSYFMRTSREVLWLLTGISKRINNSSLKPKRRVSPSGGSVVAIIGCDGAGKSTTLKYLKKEFGKKIDVSNIYLGSGDGSSSLLRYPMRLVARKVGGKGLGRSVKNNNKDSKKSTFKAKLYSAAKVIWAITLAIEKKNKLKKITKARNNGILVLADRYPQIDVKGFNDGPLLYNYKYSRSKLLRNLVKWEESIYKKAYINPPDLVIKLMITPEIAVKRKPEMTTSEVISKIEAVKKINLSSNISEIDTSKDKIKSCGEVMEEIWRVI